MRIRGAVADVTFAWASLEDQLVGIVAASLGRMDEYAMASAIYFAPANLETRIAIVDRVVRESLHEHAIESEFLSVWATFENSLHRLRKTRNKIIHGSLLSMPISPTNERRTVRVSSQLFDVQRRRTHKNGQLPGLGYAEITAHRNAVSGLFNVTATLRDIMWNINDEKPAALLQILHELAASRRTSPPR
jgi:hypothetical protein